MSESASLAIENLRASEFRNSFAKGGTEARNWKRLSSVPEIGLEQEQLLASDDLSAHRAHCR